jgi:hypothetical protein
MSTSKTLIELKTLGGAALAPATGFLRNRSLVYKAIHPYNTRGHLFQETSYYLHLLGRSKMLARSWPIDPSMTSD